MITIKINPEKIRDVIGKGGAVIRALTEETGTHDRHRGRRHGHDRLASMPRPATWRASASRTITAEVEVGKIYEGTGAAACSTSARSCSVLPGKDGLLHISQIAKERVNQVSDYLKEGQIVRVKVLEADEKGRVRLSMKAAAEEDAAGKPGRRRRPSEPATDRRAAARHRRIADTSWTTKRAPAGAFFVAVRRLRPRSVPRTAVRYLLDHADGTRAWAAQAHCRSPKTKKHRAAAYECLA